MARRGRPTVAIELSEHERETLQRWTRRHTSAQALALRSRIVLACDEGLTNGQVAQREGCHPSTVSKWRHRFAVDRLEGLVDAPRPGAARTVSDATVEAVVVDTLETAPPDATALVDAGAGRQARAVQDPPWPRSGGRSDSSRGARTASRCPPTPT
jgi:transposase-like protein